MRKSTRIISTTLAAMMAVSTVAVGTASVSAAKVKKPTSVKAKNTAKGIKITWKKVKGAKKYQVFRGKKKITTTKKKTYTDKKAKAGKTYKYTVKAVKGKKVSKKSKAAKVVRLTKPVFTSKTDFEGKSDLAWKRVKGAKKYYVYRDSKKIATIAKASYVDAKVSQGKSYTYRVKAVNGKSTSVFSAKAKVTISYDFSEVLVDVLNNKAYIKWAKVTGAASYRITKRAAGEDKETTLATVTGTTYEDDLGTNPNAYSYKVYVLNSAGKVLTYADENAINIPEGSYYTDTDGNLHVKLTLGKDGDNYVSYNGGKELYDTYKDKTTITVDEESAKVVTVKDGAITPIAKGNATVKVEISDVDICKTIYSLIKANIDRNFKNDLTTGIFFVEVTVTE